MTYRYFWCKLCQTVLRRAACTMHCGEFTTFITDAEARERIEGRPFKGRRKLTGVVASRGDTFERRMGLKRFVQIWTNPYPPKEKA